MAWDPTSLLSPVLLLLLASGDKKLRFSIQQSSQFNSFTVTMTDLKIDDSGFYRCGIVANNTSVFLRTILLVVSKGNSSDSATGTFPTLRAHTFSTTQDPISMAARSSTSSVIIPVVCGLISKTLVFTVLFIVTQKSFRQQTMKAHNSNS
ncbi:triggering receptor expressed on myeloid cells 1-like isoform X4 [Mus pahari]|uniref:triggering receptor expressed on myeloid cells 1-like isoform X4 n=1 Tax=Mus pahari TaxID=10093 RepID=UPI000A30ECDD|nr:triggering receptor expressed on myeloid cells 1-like isoform X4 [Mus pahari]